MARKIERRNIPLPESIRKARARETSALAEPKGPSPQEAENLKRQFPCQYPINGHMRNFADRLTTFDCRWPQEKVRATKQDLAKAGFYFLGVRDRAKCWYCNGGLQNWELDDEPFTEHAKWFPGCEYVLQKKGVDFVKKIVAIAPANLNRPPLRYPRFDHRTGKILPVNRGEEQPVMIDSQAVKTGAVLRNHNTQNFTQENAPMETEEPQTSQPNAAASQSTAQSAGTSHQNTTTSSQTLASSAIAHQPPEAHNAGIKLPVASATQGTVNELSTEKELKKLEFQRMCKKCFKKDSVASVVLMPCGHLVLCRECVNGTKRCPLCKMKIREFIRSYLP